jgi:uncharacterized protein GlcG (DUF336 family)
MKQLMRLMLLVGLITLWNVGPAWSDDRPEGDGRAGLTAAQASTIFTACQDAARDTPSGGLRPVTKHTIMWCAVMDREGRLLLIRATDTGEAPGAVLHSDAWRGSIEIAIAKAYTGLAFSTDELALTSRTIGLLARTDFPNGSGPIGTDTGPAPLFGIGDTNLYRPLTGSPSLNPDDSKGGNHHGIVTFAGGIPVYSNPNGVKKCESGGGVLLGAVGVSGDGVDEDEAVALGAIQGAGFCTKP